jgi:hypothetical protein
MANTSMGVKVGGTISITLLAAFMLWLLNTGMTLGRKADQLEQSCKRLDTNEGRIGTVEMQTLVYGAKIENIEKQQTDLLLEQRAMRKENQEMLMKIYLAMPH